MSPTSNVYERFNGTYIEQLEKGTWKSKIGVKSTDIPNGIIMTRSNFQGIVRQKHLKKYLEGICNRLLKHSPVSKVPFEIIITGSQGYGAAIATPDGVIAVPFGFLSSVESEDEIAWLLVHELSHVILRHHDIEWVEQYHDKSLTALEQTLGAINLFNQIRTSFNNTADTELYADAEKALKINALLYKLNTRGLIPAWQRDQEDEADLLGLDLVVKSGYDLSVSILVLEKILQWSGEEEKKILNLLDRKKYFDKVLDDLQDAPTLEQIRGYISEFLQNEIDAVNNWASRTHRMTQKRIESLAEYMDREYEEVENNPSVSAWKKLVERRAIKTVLRRYQNVWEAERLLSDYISDEGNDGMLADIQKKIRLALKGENQYDSKPRIVYSKLREEQGKNILSIKNLKLALKEPNTSLAVYKQLMNLHQTSENYNEALAVLNKANREFNNPKILYPLRIKLEVLAGNQAQALSFTKKCKRKARKYYKSCRKAFETAKPKSTNPEPTNQPTLGTQLESSPKRFWQIPAIPLPF